MILTGSSDGIARIWDALGGFCLQTLPGHTDWIWPVRWSPDGTKVLTGSHDKKARIWDAETGNCLKELSGHTDCIASVRWSPDGTKVLTRADNGIAKMWDVATGVCIYTLSSDADWIVLVKWSRGSKKVLTVSLNRTVKIWDLTGGMDFLQQLFVVKAMQSGFDIERYPEDSCLRSCYCSLPQDIKEKVAHVSDISSEDLRVRQVEPRVKEKKCTIL